MAWTDVIGGNTLRQEAADVFELLARGRRPLWRGLMLSEATRCGRRQQMSLNYWHEVAGPFGVD